MKAQTKSLVMFLLFSAASLTILLALPDARPNHNTQTEPQVGAPSIVSTRSDNTITISLGNEQVCAVNPLQVTTTCYSIGVDRLDSFPANTTGGILSPNCSFAPDGQQYSSLDCTNDTSGFCQLGSYYVGFTYESLSSYQTVYPWVTFVAGPGCGPNTFCEWRVDGCGPNACGGPTPVSTPTPTPTSPPIQSGCAFYEAESNMNTRAGAAVIQGCPSCSGGQKVGYVGNGSPPQGGTLQFNGVTVNTTGSYRLRIDYTNGDPSRTAYLIVNNGPGMPLTFPYTGGFSTVGSLQTVVTLNAGSSNTLKFYNPGSGAWAPDFDRIGGNCGPSFFTGETALGGGWYYLQFANGTSFGYYSYLTDQNYIYHLDLGFEYLFDANNADHGIFFYDFASSSFFYTSPSTFSFLYNFSLNAWLYYLPDASNPGRYSQNPRWFFNFATGQWINL